MITFKDIRNYLEGNYHYLLSLLPGDLDPEVREEAERRMDICSGCPHLVNKKVGAGKKCNACGCKFPTITYAPEKKCPVNKW